MLKSQIFDFVQFEEKAAKHRTVNNQHAKTLHTVNNNYKNKLNKQIDEQKIPSPTQYAFRNVLLNHC